MQEPIAKRPVNGCDGELLVLVEPFVEHDGLTHVTNAPEPGNICGQSLLASGECLGVSGGVKDADAKVSAEVLDGIVCTPERRTEVQEPCQRRYSGKSNHKPHRSIPFTDRIAPAKRQRAT